MTSTVIKVEDVEEGQIAVVTLNRPEVLNALNTEMSLELGRVLDELAEQPACRAVVLTGAGDRAFCAGADLKERQAMTRDAWLSQHRVFERTQRKLRMFRKPLLTAVNGIAVAGGLEIAMSTDFIVCSEIARFGQPEVKRGIQPGAGGTQLLPRLIPLPMALRLLMTGELISAADAHRLGLVTQVCPPSELLATALDLARQISANSPIAVQQAKRAAHLGFGCPLEQGIEIELECYQMIVDHPDRYEGVAAFNDHRQPKFADVY